LEVGNPVPLAPEQRAELEKYGPERKTRTTAADTSLDTAAMLASITLIGLIFFLLWA
jgi:hypothetical protein